MPVDRRAVGSRREAIARAAYPLAQRRSEMKKLAKRRRHGGERRQRPESAGRATAWLCPVSITRHTSYVAYSRSQLQHPQRPLGPGPARVLNDLRLGLYGLRPTWSSCRRSRDATRYPRSCTPSTNRWPPHCARRRPMAAMPSVPAPITAMPCCRALTSSITRTRTFRPSSGATRVSLLHAHRRGGT